MFLSKSEQFIRLKTFKFILSVVLVSIITSGCSNENKRRKTIKELGFENYVYQAVDVGFEFKYKIIKYTIEENDNEWWEVQTYTEVFIVEVDSEDMKKIFAYIDGPGNWYVQMSRESGSLDGKPSSYTRYRKFDRGLTFSSVTIKVNENLIQVVLQGVPN